MCYMSFNIIKNNKYNIRDLLLNQVYNNYPSNNDGLGVFDGKLFKTLDVISYIKEITNIKNNFAMIHLRKATRGSVTEDNAHPYKLGNWICAHNGCFSLQSSEDKTDSYIFFQRILANLNKFEFEEIEENLSKYALGYSIIFCYNLKYNVLLIGSYGKFVRFTTNENIDFIIISTDKVSEKSYITLEKITKKNKIELFDGLEFTEECRYTFSLQKEIKSNLKEFSIVNKLILIDLNKNKLAYQANIQQNHDFFNKRRFNDRFLY